MRRVTDFYQWTGLKAVRKYRRFYYCLSLGEKPLSWVLQQKLQQISLPERLCQCWLLVHPHLLPSSNWLQEILARRNYTYWSCSLLSFLSVHCSLGPFLLKNSFSTPCLYGSVAPVPHSACSLFCTVALFRWDVLVSGYDNPAFLISPESKANLQNSLTSRQFKANNWAVGFKKYFYLIIWDILPYYF